LAEKWKTSGLAAVSDGEVENVWAGGGRDGEVENAWAGERERWRSGKRLGWGEG
jgi:hypothetical protein